MTSEEHYVNNPYSDELDKPENLKTDSGRPETFEPEEEKNSSDTPPAEHLASTVNDDLDQSLRQGECNVNNPYLEDRDNSMPPPEFKAADAGALSMEWTPPALPALPRWLFWSVLSLVLLLAGILASFLFVQTVNVLHTTKSAPDWLNIIFLPILIISCVCAFVFMLSFVWGWFKLKRFKQINLKILQELHERSENRDKTLRDFKNAKLYLQNYLEKYPLKLKGDGQKTASGLDKDAVKELQNIRGELLTRRSTDSQSWIEDFGKTFQYIIDKKAKATVNRHAMSAAMLTMVSPTALLDTVFVLGASFRMLKNICLLYNIRIGGLALPILFSRVILSAFIAGTVEQAATSLFSAATDFVNDVTNKQVIGSFAGKTLGPKIAEGIVNRYFMQRLGLATIELLRPVRGIKGS